MNSLDRSRQVALILLAAPVALLAVSVSWMVVREVVATVVVTVVETVATNL